MTHQLAPCATRAISDLSYQTNMALEIVETTARKMQRASLSVLTEPMERYTTPIPVPLSPNRIRTFIEESTQECTQFTQAKHWTEAAAEMARSSFCYPKSIDPEDLLASDDSDPMEEWLKETIETTSHAIELQRKTPFELICPNQQKNCCFRYALERVGLTNFGLIENHRTLQKILRQFFSPVTDPQDGDLILFSNGGRMTHLGICHQGKVLSKEGNLAKVAYIRPLEDLTSAYGKTVQYFRIQTKM